MIAAKQDKNQQKLASDQALSNMLFFNHWHNYENQASNILEMVRRYETPLKQPSQASSASNQLSYV